MNVMVCQVTNWPRWRAVPTQADLVSLLCLKISHLLTPPPPHHGCSLRNFQSHFLPFFLNQYAPQLLVLDIWFGNLKLTHCLFFARTLKEELGYLGCWRAAAVHMSSKTGSRRSLICVYTARRGETLELGNIYYMSLQMIKGSSTRTHELENWFSLELGSCVHCSRGEMFPESFKIGNQLRTLFSLTSTHVVKTCVHWGSARYITWYPVSLQLMRRSYW